MKPRAPEMLYLAFVTEAAFLGTKNLNPFAFKPHGIKEINLKINGEPVYYDGLKFNWTEAHYLDTYWHFCKTLGITHRDEGIEVSRLAFDKDQFIVPLDLTRFIDTNDLTAAHDLQIELLFSPVTPANLRLLCHARYANAAVIGYDREFGEGTKLLVSTEHN
jgi:hypothetical protein